MFSRRVVIILLIPGALVLVGTAGYSVIEGWHWFDALYMTVITLTTVGYGEVFPLSTAGRTFTMLLLLGGVFTLFYAATELVSAIVSGEILSALGRRRMAWSLANMRDHHIICGLGRMGRLVCKEFAARGLPFVVIERDPQRLESFAIPHGVPMHGDSTSDEILKTAGVERARSLIAVVASDADNLYITMSARLLNDRLFIVARAEDERSEQKLLRAGANRVVAPYLLGGSVVAQAVLKPNVVDFLELATRTEHLELQIEEVRIAAGSDLRDTTLEKSRLRPDLGVIIVAIKKTNGRMIFNPPPTTVLEVGDTLIVLGDRQHLDELDKLASG
jgi:voltage-gated potassium channel